MLADLPPPVPERVERQSAADAYAEAVRLRRAGRHREAAALLRRVLADQPDNLDARLNLGLALAALDDLDGARSELLIVAEQAPEYADAHLALARIALRRNDLQEAERRLGRADLLRPGDPEISALRRGLAPQQPFPWRLGISASESDLSGGAPPWRAQSVELGRSLDERTSVSALVERTERFDRRDVYLEAQLARRLTWGGGYLALGGAPDADYRPELAFRAGVEAPLRSGFGLLADASISRFPAGTITSMQPGLAWTGASERITVTGRWINTWDEAGARQSGYAVSAVFRVHPRFALRAGFADAPETSEGVTTAVVARTLGVEAALTDRVVVRVTGVDEDRGAVDRREVGLGLGWRF